MNSNRSITRSDDTNGVVSSVSTQQPRYEQEKQQQTQQSQQHNVPLHTQQNHHHQQPSSYCYDDRILYPNGSSNTGSTSSRVWTHPSEQHQQQQQPTTKNHNKNREHYPIESNDRNDHRSIHRRRSHFQQQQQQQHIQPLILDATASPSRVSTTWRGDIRNTAPPPSGLFSTLSQPQPQYASSSSSSSSSSLPFQQYPPMKILPSPPPINSNNSSHHHHHHQQQQQQHSPHNQSGYLYKLGVNIPIYKRRFFILPSSSSSTILYYYISPHDTEPRGCYNIFNATVEYKNFDIDTDDDTDVVNDDYDNNNNTYNDVDNPRRTYRFALVWRENKDDTTVSSQPQPQQRQQQQRVELEARTKHDAIQWIRTIQKRQISVVAQEQIQQAQTTIQSHQQQINTLQKQISDYKYIEQERDDAMNDATLYRNKLQQLDEGIRLLTQQIRPKEHIEQQRSTATVDTDTDAANVMTDKGSKDDRQSKNNSDGNHNEQEVNENDTPTNAALQDVVATTDIDPTKTPLDLYHVPGNHFNALYNVVVQLQDQLRLGSMKSMTAIEDVTIANQQIQQLQCRNEQMEQHLCQIWEENCSLRKSIKHGKKEKRILVKEIKSLRDATPTTATTTTSGSSSSNSTSAATIDSTNTIPGRSSHNIASSISSSLPPLDQSKNFTEEFLNASDEDKLIQELEDHVLSSIRLHEEFLSSVPIMTTGTNHSVTPEEAVQLDGDNDDDDDDVNQSIFAPSNTTDETIEYSPLDQRPKVSTIKQTLHPDVPLFEQQNNELPIVSLFDNDDDDDTESDNDALDMGNRNYIIGCNDAGNYGDVVIDDELETDITTPTTNTSSKKPFQLSAHDTPDNAQNDSNDDEDDDDDTMNNRPNPLLNLDKYDQYNNLKPTLETESTVSQRVLEHHQPTYQLSCPLTDAISTTTTNSDISHPIPKQISSSDLEGELHVYHITFYSRKIGIQFQKVPPTPIKAKGLLTEAMTDDLTTSTAGTTKGVVGSSTSTAAELRRIAAISMSSKRNHPNSKHTQNDICDVATPVDAVLVCGFHGFDESNRTSNCQRPKLGARLVAFDGVSIEIGRWTFSAVRKAIQSCGRPLTLSFRNDYLTKEQRTILTKAVLDVDLTSSASSSTQRHTKESVPGCIPIRQCTNDLDINQCREDPVATVMTDDMSESAGGDSDYVSSFPQSFSGNRSVNSLAQYRSFYETRSYGSSSVGGDNHKIRSFSEAGGSAATTTTNSSVLSAIGPLVSNLLYRPRRPSEPFTPEYLRRAPEFVEETPQHHDFQSELL